MRSSRNLAHGHFHNLGSVFSSTAGIIFLGTPHRGSMTANLGGIVAKIAEVAMRNPNTQLLDSLSPDSNFLESQRNQFSLVSEKINVACFYEERPASGFTGLVSLRVICLVVEEADEIRLCHKRLLVMMAHVWPSSLYQRTIWICAGLLVRLRLGTSGSSIKLVPLLSKLPYHLLVSLGIQHNIFQYLTMIMT